jgi:glycogen debranching enzyme
LTALLGIHASSWAQQSFETTSVGPERFIAAHGSKAVAMGYASGGLELWAYPLQIVSDYQVGFRLAGSTSEVEGAALLRRVSYDPQGVTRIYIGPDFIVQERLFVPLDQPAIRITYTVEGRGSVDVVVHFAPILNLMWPGSIGGQNTQWSQTASAYRLADGTQKYSAWIGSQDVVSHDEVRNSTEPGMAPRRVAFAVRPKPIATVVVTTDKELLIAGVGSAVEAHSHYDKLAADSLRIETPDSAVNQQLAWALVALDQAWVCNPVLGCGMVAGYGPSRNARRPQYDWFFAGDGLIATEALVSSGNYSRAKEELAFIARYQDASSGMIWHELSQSADPADWATKYPYMYVHVDITFEYLAEVERYVMASGDTHFIEQHWQGLEAAYRYCRSLLNAQDGLPRIPAAKEGGDEQDKMTDDAGLSSSWVAAAAAFAKLARLAGHDAEAEEARRLSKQAQASAVARYWDGQRSEWIDGYTEAGRPIFRRGANGITLVSGHILDQQRSGVVLDRLASADFETDWGTRGVASSSSEYDPSSYSKGSVSAASTAHVATVYWQNHRPFTAFPIWNAIVPWGTLDSMGHLHEVLAGDYFHQQVESVPEQTWSSAAFVSAAVHGLLSLERDAAANRIDFSPHLPARWDKLSVSNIPVKGGALALTVARVPDGLALEMDNSGGLLTLAFSPEIPLGAHIQGAALDGKAVEARQEEHAQDTHANLSFSVRSGRSRCLVRYQGGVEIAVDDSAPVLGEASRGVKILSVSRLGRTLQIEADVAGAGSTIALRTSELPLRARGATLHPLSGAWYELLVDPETAGGYHRANIAVEFSHGQMAGKN